MGRWVESNKWLYASADVVRWYARCDKLQGAEARVLAELRPQLGRMRMLDVGVGGGRTTLHFAPAARAYVGVDYIPAMIDACRARFAGKPYTFDACDARDLSAFEDASFDFVLFSHCGIDYVDHDARATVFSELRRVLVPEGLLCFATHNLARANELFVPGSRVKRLMRWNSLRRLRRENPNWNALGSMQHAEINDGAFNFSLRTYHVRPSHQVHELERLGFGQVRPLRHATGADLDRASIDDCADPWLYFTARRHA